jgi:hypothetical protein
MKKFAIGVVAGASSLLLAAPLVVQVAGAASSSSAGAKVMREAPTQACMQAMLKVEDVRLAEFDSMVAKHKQAMQQRRDSLATVAAIADDTARKDALQKLHETMRTSMQTAQENMSDAMKSALEAAKTACGNSMMLNMGSGMGGPGMMKGGMHKNGRGMMRGNSDGMFGGWGK